MFQINQLSIFSKDQGISIIEVLVTILIISAGILAIAHLQSTSIYANYQAQKKQNAMFIANEHMEKAITIAINNDIEFQNKVIKANIGNFFYTVTTSIINGEIKGTKKIIVKVKWDKSCLDLDTVVSMAMAKI